MLEFRIGGRKVSSSDFSKRIVEQATDRARSLIERRVHGIASSIVDPATGKCPAVILRWIGKDRFEVKAKGSPAYCRELERALGLKEGSVTSTTPDKATPYVYLAHGWEDHETLAKPLASALLDAGIDVWLDEWEIRPGDSLRQKMEEGLDKCTHFLVLLTENSIDRPWVKSEVDVGFMNALEGKATFIGVRVGLELDRLSPFLKTRLCPRVDLDDPRQVDGLIADILGVSKKPPLGSMPSYVKTAPPGLSGWSKSALAVAEYLVRNSQHGRKHDPWTNPEKVAEATMIPVADVRLGRLELQDRGLVEETATINSEDFFPLESLFVEFDRHFLGFDTEKDGLEIATVLVNEGKTLVASQDLAAKLPDWAPRRLNSALAYLIECRAIERLDAMANVQYVTHRVRVTERTVKFIKDQA